VLDLHSMYDEVKAIIDRSDQPELAWRDAAGLLRGEWPSLQIGALDNVDVAREIDTVRAQILALLEREPIPADVDALYFGLFDAQGSGGTEDVFTGFYVSGVVGYDPANEDSLAGPAYFPEGRYLDSPLLDTIRDLLQPQPSNDLACETLTLAAAGILARFASPADRPWCVVVGFDEGNVIEVRRPIGA
jgi:hypothetical protein